MVSLQSIALPFSSGGSADGGRTTMHSNSGQRKRRSIGRHLERLEARRLLAGVVINEFLASNSHGIADADGDHSDWIELRNTDAAPANVGGWYLTDDAANPIKWQIPATTTIAANGFLLVFASGKNRAVAGQELHTNFSLNGTDGEYLGLI